MPERERSRVRLLRAVAQSIRLLGLALSVYGAPAMFRAACTGSILLAASTALGDQRFDHRGAVGLVVGGGLEHKTASASDLPAETGFRTDADVGITYAIGYDGDEIVAFARGTFGGPLPDLSVAGGYRGYFGLERWKTFVELGGALHLWPKLAVGPRIAFGVQYELTSNVGAFLSLGTQLGFGRIMRFDGELIGGVQLRSYLLE